MEENSQSRRIIKKLAIPLGCALFCGLAPALISRGQTASPNATPPRHKVQVKDPVLAGRLASQGARLIADYGGFQLFEADQAAVASLGPAADVRDHYNTIFLNAARLDTTVPEVKALRQTVGSFTGKRMHLVQFGGPVRPEWREALLKAGAQIVSYVPENAYLVYGDAAALASVQNWAAKSPQVQWEGSYRDEYKIHPKARLTDAQGHLRQIGTDIFAIQLAADAGPNAETLHLLDTLKLEPLRRQNAVLNYVNVLGRFAAGDLARIAAQPDVVSIMPWFMPHKMDERQDEIVAGNLSGDVPSGPRYLAWLESKGFTQAQFDASAFLVDMSDSGIDDGTTSPNHFGLYQEGVMGSGKSRVFYNRLEGTPNNPGSTLAGCDGHGTINTHIVGGYDNSAGFPFEDNSGYHYGLGVCPFARFGSSVIFDPDNFTSPNYSTLQSAAYKGGARISNNSWGGSTGVYDSDSQEYDALVRDADNTTSGNQEMVIVFAAGNVSGGATSQSILEPGTAKNVITVGATEGVQAMGGTDGCGLTDAEAESANTVANFSCLGPCDDGRHKPDLVAPGTHISGGVAQAANPGPYGTVDSCFLNDASGVCGGVGTNFFFPAGQEFYTTSSGTSHSTPAVTGGCALLRQYFINNGWSPPSPAMTKAYLMNSARYVTGSGGGDTLWSDSQGMGDLDLGAAFDGAYRILRDQLAGDLFTGSGQSRTYVGTVADTNQPFRVTLAWTDAPGNTTGSAANNDLDLTVTIGGVTYLGNVFNGAYSTTGGAADALDNVESVFLPAGTTGSFTVTVTAANINSVGVPNAANALNQDFALVAYNANGFEISSATLTAESCTPTNGVIDPGETVTVNFALQNGGIANYSNLVVTLLPLGGVTSPDSPKTVPLLVAGGGPVTVPFTFMAEGNCGGTLTANLQLEAGTNNLGTATCVFTLGQLEQTTVLAQNFDSVTAPALPGGWSTDVIEGTVPWTTTNRNADTPPNAAFGPDSSNIGVSELLSPVIAINGSTAQLVFRQSYYLEAQGGSSVAFDGGVLEMQIGSGGFNDILAAGGTFVAGGYNKTITSGEGADNDPLAGRQCWSGISGPYTTNSYFTTTVQLPSSAAGQNVQFKWRLGTDSGNQLGGSGWWVDTIMIVDGIYTCCTGQIVTTPEIISPARVFQTTNETVRVTGVAAPGLILTLLDNGVTNNAVAVSASGTFSLDASLEFGTNLLSAVVLDMGTNYTSAMTAVTLAPPAPSLSAPAASGPVVAVSGGGLAGALVTLFSGTASTNTALATFTNNSAGAFSGIVNLADGTNLLFATELVNGTASAAGSVISVTVLTVPAPVIASPLSGLVTNYPSLALKGTGLAGATLYVYDGASPVATNLLTHTGVFNTALRLSNGRHNLTASQTIDGIAGPSSAAVEVELTLVPQWVATPQDAAMFAGGSVNFLSSALGAAPLRYVWQKNGTTIAGATSPSLALKSITASSAGSYVVLATNSYGFARSTAAVLTLIPNPFTNLVGNYYGLFSETNPQFDSSGLIKLSLTKLGAYSGNILSAGGSHSFTGAFTPAGQSLQNVARGTGQTPLFLDLNLDLVNGTRQILGTVSNGNWVAALQADLAVYTTNAPEKGNYTLIFSGDSDGSASPGGDGFGKVAVTAAGMVSLTGTLSDNTAIAPTAVSVSKYGQWPLYIPLYGAEGSLSGWVNFTNGTGFSFEGGAAWFRTNSSGKLYPHGFTNSLSMLGSTFTPGAAKIPALAFTNLEITLSQGGLPETLSNFVTLELNGKFLTNGSAISNFTLSLVPSTGLISGSFLDPATHLSTPIKGAVFQQQTNGAGFFLGTNTTGSFYLSLP